MESWGIYASNYQVRMDTMAHVLHYRTKAALYDPSYGVLHFRELPGVNRIVGILIYTGITRKIL
jgi:DNA-directed RNA polymerase II subunit RPB2